MDSLITQRPLPQKLDGTVRGSVIENYKLKVGEGLVKNAADALVQKGKRVVYGHNNANQRIRDRSHTRLLKTISRSLAMPVC